jgi:hypothetical protein
VFCRYHTVRYNYVYINYAIACLRASFLVYFPLQILKEVTPFAHTILFLGPYDFAVCFQNLPTLVCIFVVRMSLFVLFVCNYLCCSVAICVVQMLLFVLFGCYLCCSDVIICVVRLLFVLFYVLFVCKCVLPPGDNPIAVNK